MELTDILKNDDPVTPEQKPEAVETPATTEAPVVETVRSRRKDWQDKEQAAQGRKRNPDGTFAPEPEKQAEPEKAPEKAAEKAPEKEPEKAPEKPVEQLTDKERGLIAAARAERQKRQALEQRLAMLEQQQAQPQNQEAPKTFWDNPDQALQQYHKNVQETIIQNKVVMSEEMARRQYPDYEEKLSAFQELLQANPWLAEKVAEAPNPSEVAYRIGKNRMELEQAGNLDGFRKKIEQETEARVRKQFEEQAAAKEAERRKLADSLPRSLSDVRGSPPTSTPVWGGPTPLDSVIKH